MDKKIMEPFELKKLHGCCILGFAYDSDERRFTIVSDYSDASPGSMRDLIAFVFNDVRRFQREAGARRNPGKCDTSYPTSNSFGGYEFEEVKIRGCQYEWQHVRFWFGSYQGGIAFEYGSLEAYRRGSRIVKKGKDFIYFDIVSKKEFDFYNPFPDVLPIQSRDN